MERAQATELQKLLAIEESALRQKSRIQWIQHGDGNYHIFFQAMKERYNRNCIDALFDEHERKQVIASDIQQEILGFYKKPLGSSVDSLPM